MLMSYSVCSFLAGLTILVCTPLLRRTPWNTESNIAVTYLAVAVITSLIFLFCSFWVYRFVDLEHDVLLVDLEPDDLDDATEAESSQFPGRSDHGYVQMGRDFRTSYK